MLNILLILVSAFSFLLPDEGNLAQSMGFRGNNPAQLITRYMEIGGHLGALDSREANLFISSGSIFIKSTYKSLGKIEVRGPVPQDDGMVPSYPYLFNVEIGSNMNLTARSTIGASCSIFEHRILTYDIKGYLFNLGGIYRVNALSFAGYARNIGPRMGYFKNDKYSVPTYGSFYGTYTMGKGQLSIGVGLLNFSTSNLTLILDYSSKISRCFSLGGELITEKDLSVGYRFKYPLRFMFAFRKDKTHIGIRFDIPSGGFNIKSYAYLGVVL